jgi:Aldehyde dehydrogenase family
MMPLAMSVASGCWAAAATLPPNDRVNVAFANREVAHRVSGLRTVHRRCLATAGGGGNLDVLDPARGGAAAEHKGARVEAGGKRPDHRKQGSFFEPTVPSALPDHALALAEENFGPIAAITPFGDAEEAYTRGNAVPQRSLGLCVHARFGT